MSLLNDIPIIFKPIQKNYTRGRVVGGIAGKITTLILHTEGAVQSIPGTEPRSLFPWFNGNGRNVSAHYYVRFDGVIEQYVRDEDTSHHAGDLRWNLHSLGIEFQDNGRYHTSLAYQPKQLENAARLVAYLVMKYNLVTSNTERGGIRKHNDITPKVCPGALPFENIVARAEEIIVQERALCAEKQRKADELKQKKEALIAERIAESENIEEVEKEIEKIEEQEKKASRELELPSFIDRSDTKVDFNPWEEIEVSEPAVRDLIAKWHNFVDKHTEKIQYSFLRAPIRKLFKYTIFEDLPAVFLVFIAFWETREFENEFIASLVSIGVGGVYYTISSTISYLDKNKDNKISQDELTNGRTE